MAEVEMSHSEPQAAELGTVDALEVPCDNEHTDAVPDNGVDSTSEQTEQKQPSHPTRLYFLRLPKPDVSDLELQKERAEEDLNAYKQACTKALAAAKLAHDRRLQRREERNQSQEQFNISLQDRNTLMERLRPVSDMNKKVREQRRGINDKRIALPASSVAELDIKIRDLEFRQAHEHMSRRDENNLIKEIRDLKKIRPEVHKFEMECQAVENTKDEFATFQSSKADLERQLDVVKEEFAVAGQQLDEKKQLLQDAHEQHEAVSREFDNLKKLQEAKYKECKSLRDLISSKQTPFYDNRRFSQSVRTLLKSGQIDEAMKQCNAITEEHINSLLDNTELYNEYVASWELTRKYAVSQAAINLSNPANKVKTNAAAPVVKSSDAIIADIMAEIEGRVPVKSAAEVAAQSVAMPASDTSSKAKANKSKAAAAALAPEADAFMERQALDASAAKPAAAPQPAQVAAPQPQPKKQTKVHIPVIEEEPFVPPAMYLKQAPVLTPEEQKHKIREEQMAKAAEAEERKKKRAERKVKKAEKAKEVAKQKQQEAEVRQVAERARIEREAAAQRALAQKKKEAQAVKAAAAAEKAALKTAARSMGKSSAVMRSKVVKSTWSGTVKKVVRDNSTAISILVATVGISGLAVAALYM